MAIIVLPFKEAVATKSGINACPQGTSLSRTPWKVVLTALPFPQPLASSPSITGFRPISYTKTGESKVQPAQTVWLF
jgi:hypothetical protein